MPLERGDDVVDVRSGNKAKLAVGDRLGRNGVDRPAGSSGCKSENIECVGTIHALGRLQVGLTPPFIDLRPLVPAVDLDVIGSGTDTDIV